MAMDYKTVEVKLILEVGTYTNSDPDKVLAAWIEDRVGQVGKTHTQYVSLDGEEGNGFGDIEIKSIRVSK